VSTENGNERAGRGGKVMLSYCRW